MTPNKTMSRNSHILVIFARPDRPGSPKTGPEVRSYDKRRTDRDPPCRRQPKMACSAKRRFAGPVFCVRSA
jgi:hypothetical protein